MKKIYIIVLALIATTNLSAQDFDKNIASARSNYSSGNLHDSRFAMEQILRDLDVAIGKEILKLLPAKIGTLNANVAEDNLTGTGAYVGLYVSRNYAASGKQGSIEIINNSPLITSLNAMLNMPLVGGMMVNENQKTIKVQGYKSIVTKNANAETGKTDYELQIPMNNTLVTVKMNDTTEAEITAAANTIPLAKIVQMAQ